ncbi:MAG: DUF899 family protein [Phycisphaerales bacterium]|nr:DUF899 family protein [Phycisphaerales bacterium]
MHDIEQKHGDLAELIGGYSFVTPNGAVTLAELFAGKRDLLIIHNMGRRCAYCTMWADGFNGLLRHLEDRAAFVLASPDEPGVQREFAESRGWGFRMVSTKGSSFNADLGFEPEPGKVAPGVSALYKQDDGTIVRTGKAVFGPGDPFNGAWHLFALLKDGANGWGPK